VHEVDLNSDSLNSGDVFVLSTEKTIFIWTGKDCSAFERNKGGTFATALRDQGHFHQQIVTLDDGKDDLPDFWKPLGGKKRIKSASEGGSDADADVGKSLGLKVILRTVASGQKFDKVAEGKVSRAVLKSDGVFIVDSGYEVFVWVGKGSSPLEQKAALMHAHTYLNEHGRPNYVPITKVNEGVILPAFDAVFATV